MLGFDKLENYYANYSFFGAAIGPIANRTGGAKFTLNGTEYHLDVNDGVNNLHSHLDKAFHKRVWDAQVGEDFVKFTLKEADGSLGLPGNRKVSLVYTLTDDNRIEMHYHMESDRDAVFNMTNHSYFNLKGQGNGKIEDHVLWLKASHFTPVVKGSIPTGEIAPVAGTPMDFTTAHRVGEHIADDYEQTNLAGGYDHNWVIDDFDGSLKHFATVEEPESGRIMKAYTNLPGVQFYAGNFIGEDEYKDLDKDGVIYIGDLPAGEYEVALKPISGYRTPLSATDVRVKDKVEYVAIDDISLLIKTEAEIDAEAEDSAEANTDGDDTEIRQTSGVSKTGVLGIDVSKWQKEIDWDKVKNEGVDFAIIRCGYRGSVTGSLVEDPYFEQNIKGARAAGIKVGVYFFTQAVNEVEAVEEASMVISLVRDYELQYPVFIDTEGAGGKRHVYHGRYCPLLRGEAGRVL